MVIRVRRCITCKKLIRKQSHSGYCTACGNVVFRKRWLNRLAEEKVISEKIADIISGEIDNLIEKQLEV